MMNELEKAITKWFKDYGFDDVAIESCDRYSYDLVDHVIHVDDEEYDDELFVWFEQFMYEYGMKMKDIPGPVLAFLHELGHYATIDQFSEFNLIACQLTKFEYGHTYEDMCEYWCVPDEFAACMWALDFINSYPEAVIDLIYAWIYPSNSLMEARK